MGINLGSWLDTCGYRDADHRRRLARCPAAAGRAREALRGEVGWIVGGLSVGVVVAALRAPERVLDQVEDAIVLAVVWVTAVPLYAVMLRRAARLIRT